MHALRAVDFEIEPGELVAVCGENGAGKSTLMKILAGVLRADAGSLQVDGEEVRFGSVRDAQDRGIALIHQELELCDNLTVAENVGLGNEPSRAGFLDRKRLAAESGDALRRLGLDLDPWTPLAQLPIGKRQLVEIAKALARRARVLILDEPTSSLSRTESERLFDVLLRLRADGTSLVYISHRLPEIERLADRVVVLRDGVESGTLARGEISRLRLLELMLGAREIVSEIIEAKSRHADEREPVLELRSVGTAASGASRIDLTIGRGEIVGLAGLVGAGRSELLRAVFGIDPRSGSVRIGGAELRAHDPIRAQRAGLALLPEDRKAEGLLLESSVGENLTLAALPRFASAGFIARDAERQAAAACVRDLRIKASGLEQLGRQLSGGNQQKIVLGKALMLEPRVLLLDEPTRGIDVGAKREIWTRIRELAANGIAVLVVSSEFEELQLLADRVAVMALGRVVGILDKSELHESRVLDMASGVA